MISSALSEVIVFIYYDLGVCSKEKASVAVRVEVSERHWCLTASVLLKLSKVPKGPKVIWEMIKGLSFSHTALIGMSITAAKSPSLQSVFPSSCVL